MKRIHLASVLVLSGAVAGLVAGCGSDGTGTGGAGGTGGSVTDGGAGPGPGPGPGPGGGGTGGTGGNGGMGAGGPDTNNSCAEADVMEELMNQAGGTFFEGMGVIDPAQDGDYYKFTANAGDWIWLATDANPDDIPEMIDTVITLYNEDGSTQLAQVDDAFPRVSTDSELFFRATETGTYCLKVEEFSDWAGQTPEGDPTFGFRVLAIPVDFALYEQFSEDTEVNNTLAAPQTGLSYTVSMTNTNFTQLAGVFDDDADVDVYAFEAGTGALAMALDFTPGGTDGFGSTQEPGVINLYDPADLNNALARLDVANGSDGFSSVPIPAGGTVLIEVQKPAGAAGANPFYFLKTFGVSAVNEQETDDTANNASAGAGQAAATPNGDTTSYFIGGTLPAGDSDWWQIPNVASGQDITVVCSAQRAGSGVGDFTVDYYGTNAGGASVQNETENATANILWSNLSPDASQPAITNATAGTHFIRLQSTMDIAGVTSRFYLCGVHVATP
jgi:Bacterial pre-peptidase C-terminal domain